MTGLVFMRRIARVLSTLLIVTVTSMVTLPAQAALQLPAAPKRLPAAEVTPGDRYAALLDDIKTLTRNYRPVSVTKDLRAVGPNMRMEVTIPTHPAAETNQVLSTLKAKALALAELEQNVKAEFDATEQHLKAHQLPAEILARHQAAAAEFQTQQTQFKTKLDAALQSSADAKSRDAALASLADFIDKNQKSKPHNATDPNKLPWGTPKSVIREPITTAQGFKTSLFKPEPVLLASAGSLSGLTLPTTTPSPTPTADDLAETDDIQLTQAIKAQATALNNNPVKIYNWVRNTIEYIPSYGSIQGADLTLQNKRGNAFDTASLLIALYRASGIPARYVYGTVEIPADKVMNWVGGVTKSQAAQSLLGQGGIPNVGLNVGGQIKAIRMEHVWVEAYVDYIPSRGAINKTPDTWVAMDASYKQYAYTQGMDIKTNVLVDKQNLIDQARIGATVNDTEGWVQNLNQEALKTQLTDYQTRINSYIAAQNPNATVGDVLGVKRITTENHPILLSTLPYNTVAIGAKMATLPANLKGTLRLNLYTSDNQTPQLTVSLSLSHLSGKRLSASYSAATQADTQTVASYQGARQLPVYLVNQKLAIQLDDQVLAEYGAQRMGVDQRWTYTLSIPGMQEVEEDFKFASVVGDQIVFGVNGNGVSVDQVAARYQAVNPNTSLENLHHLAIGYWARADASDAMLAKMTGVVTYRMPSVGMFTQPLSVVYSWGVPRLGSYKSYAIDIRSLVTSAITLQGESAKDFFVQSGPQKSYLEGRVFEEIFDDSPGIGHSAVAVLNQAGKDGIPLWRIDSSNLQSYLAISSLSPEMQSEINDAVSNGLIVTAPQALADADFWRAEGYIAIDPATGAGAYILKGANGGEFQDCEEQTQPKTKAIRDQITTFLVLGLIALILAGIIGGSGGLATPVAASVFQIAMRMVGVAALTWSATSYAAGNCKSNGNCHRGRFQAQGGDITDGKGTGNGRVKSEPWAQPNPLTLSRALQLLEHLKAQLTPNQLLSRATYLTQAETHIKNAAAGGGVCAPHSPPSFGPDPRISEDVKYGVRIDIEVRAGEAFVP